MEATIPALWGRGRGSFCVPVCAHVWRSACVCVCGACRLDIVNWWPWARSMGPSMAPPCPHRADERLPRPHAPRANQATSELLYGRRERNDAATGYRNRNVLICFISRNLCRLKMRSFCAEHSQLSGVHEGRLIGICLRIKCLALKLLPSIHSLNKQPAICPFCRFPLVRLQISALYSN